MKTALIQARNTGDVAADYDNMFNLAETACKNGAQVICFQELCLSLYFCQREDPALFDLAIPLENKFIDGLRALAKRKQAVIVFPFFEKRAEGLFHNSAAVIDADGSVLGLYRKMHIPHDPCFYEKYYFSPGDLGYKVFKTAYGRIGVLICWDQWFPEAARITALKGADIIFYPTAIGGLVSEGPECAAEQLYAWQTVQRGHAVANGVFVAACNRVGREDNIEFWGSSFICDPFGRTLAQAGKEGQEILMADCNPGVIAKTRRAWPFLRDRRAETYQPLTRMFNDD